MQIAPYTQAARGGLSVLFAALTAFLGFMNDAQAGTFSVSPILIELSEANPIAALKIRNSGNTLLSIQCEVLDWTQPRGRDQLKPTTELLVTPPIFSIKPGATQTIRAGLRVERPGTQERAFRLFLTEIPSPDQSENTGLNIVTRLSLPVFVTPQKGTPQARLKWSAHLMPDGNVMIKARNVGTGHAKITAIRLSTEGLRDTEHAGNDYLLPGSEQHWTLPASGHLTEGQRDVGLTITVNGERRTALAPLE